MYGAMGEGRATANRAICFTPLAYSILPTGQYNPPTAAASGTEKGTSFSIFHFNGNSPEHVYVSAI